MSIFAEQIPEAHRIAAVGKFIEAQLCHPFLHFGVIRAFPTQAGQIAFDVSQEDRHSHLAEGLCHHLEGHCFTCTCGSSNQPMAIGHLRQQIYRTFALCNPSLSILVHGPPPSGSGTVIDCMIFSTLLSLLYRCKQEKSFSLLIISWIPDKLRESILIGGNL